MTAGNRWMAGVFGLVGALLFAGASTAGAQCAAPACPAATCFVNDATGADAPGCCTSVTPCKTIQFAVNEASPGDVIRVAAGTYPEGANSLNINKTLTLCGAQDGVDARTRVGAETQITNPKGTIVSADNVVINGFTLESTTSSIFPYGLDMAQGTTGTRVLNNIVQNNVAGIGLANTGGSQVLICQNLIQNNNNPGSASGTGIYTDEYVCGFSLTCTNFLIEQNAFKGNDFAGVGISNTNPPNPLTNLDISTNTFDMNGRGVFLSNTDQSTIHNNSITNCTAAGSGAIRLFGSVDDLTITSNDLNTGAGWGIRMTDDLAPPTTPNSGVVINLNNIVNFVGSGGPFGGGLYVGSGAHVGPVDAECNWWGDPCGPFNVAANPLGIGQEVQEAGAPGDADFTPWLIAPSPAPASGGGTCTGTTCAAPCITDGDCDDGNPCTTDTCPSGHCVFTANNNPCNDNNPCTENDACANSACGGFPVNCDDSDACTDDTCDSAGNAFLCVHTPNGSCAHDCGNGIIEPGETCDPPGGAVGPHGAPCRIDCTYCGDGIVQAPETCDDANTVSGCRPDLPQKPLDSCLDSCTQPICADPAQIKFGTGLDMIAVHGRLVTSSSLDLANQHFVVQLTPGDSTATVIFRTSLLAGSLSQAGAGSFKYRDNGARTAGGVYALKINGKDGYYKFTMKAYGDAVGAQSDMRTQVFVGAEEWRARGLWQQLTKGWKIKNDSTFLQP